MSAKDEMRAMLAALMGNTEDDKPKVKFTDSKVCRPFLIGCCPHVVLDSTRMDIGKCRKVHDHAAKADYEKAIQTREYDIEVDALYEIRAFIRDCDRKIEKAKVDLAATQEELSSEVEMKANTVLSIGEEIGKKLAEAERLGVEGQVEESMALMTEVEKLKEDKRKAEIDYRNSMPSSTFQQQKLRVCEVCMAYLGIHDNDRRLADHFGGKLHLGFMKIREQLANLEKVVEAKAEKRRNERSSERRSRSPDRDRGGRGSYNRDRRRSRSRSGSRHRDRDDRRSEYKYSGRDSRDRSRSKR